MWVALFSVAAAAFVCLNVAALWGEADDSQPYSIDADAAS